jgi:excisionase family DNA binding protein
MPREGGDAVGVEKLYTKEEAAELLHVSPVTLGKWLRAGKITGTKIGKKWAVAESDLQAFIDENRQK